MRHSRSLITLGSTLTSCAGITAGTAWADARLPVAPCAQSSPTVLDRPAGTGVTPLTCCVQSKPALLQSGEFTHSVCRSVGRHELARAGVQHTQSRGVGNCIIQGDCRSGGGGRGCSSQSEGVAVFGDSAEQHPQPRGTRSLWLRAKASSHMLATSGGARRSRTGSTGSTGRHEYYHEYGYHQLSLPLKGGTRGSTLTLCGPHCWSGAIGSANTHEQHGGSPGQRIPVGRPAQSHSRRGRAGPLEFRCAHHDSWRSRPRQ